ncbi:hypothetical protein J4474_02150 [Candidatus Pacearchaeota archaeon]|nr:hypothetical protein [Candidatus Pacearchaeota archaeon]
MVVLTGNDLIGYIDNLKSQIPKDDSQGLEKLLHSQMYHLLEKEKEFATRCDLTIPILAIDLNGMPSVPSVKADLEKISFGETEKYLAGQRNEISPNYLPISESALKEEMENQQKNGQTFNSKIEFDVAEKDHKFTLFVRENFFVNGYDEQAQTVPVFIQEGEIAYHTMWNKLLHGVKRRKFYVLDQAMTSRKRNDTESIKNFKNIKLDIDFSRKEYRGYKGIPLRKILWEPDDYSAFLQAGTPSRVKLARKILEVLTNAFEEEISLFRGSEYIPNEALEEVLSFREIPFKNAPKKTPEQSELYKIEEYQPISTAKAKRNTTFSFLSVNQKDIGYLFCFLPRIVIEPHSGFFSFNPEATIFHFDKWLVNIDGKTIRNETQFDILSKGLNDPKNFRN